MRYAVISDIHSNIEALTAVLDHIKKRGIKQIVCLGDVVGYGPSPIECLELLMDNVVVCVKGNHDEAIVEGVCFFNTAAKEAIEWSREVVLKTEHPKQEQMWKFLKDLPLCYTLEDYLFVHASPLDPTSDYIFARDVKLEQDKFKNIFAAFDSMMFIGHTHYPCVITESLQVSTIDELGYKYQYKDEKSIINVGSVGQPRDNDTRASYLEVIDDIFFFHRVPYDYETTQKKIFENERLNNSLGERLAVGK